MMQQRRSRKTGGVQSQKKLPNKRKATIKVDLSKTQEVVVIPSRLGWAPRRIRMKLRYATQGVLNHAGTVYANSRYSPIYVYDVDPLLASTAVPGLAEWGSIYRFYRTRSSEVAVTFVNKESFPVTCYICPINYDPGANSLNYLDYFSNTLSKVRAIGGNGGNNVCDLSSSETTADFGGVPDTQQLDGYCGRADGSTVPTNQWFWIVGFETDGSAMLNGVNISVRVDMEVEFFELQTPHI